MTAAAEVLKRRAPKADESLSDRGTVIDSRAAFVARGADRRVLPDRRRATNRVIEMRARCEGIELDRRRARRRSEELLTAQALVRSWFSHWRRRG
ncbi:MAG: hypothetical protein AAF515_07985 [Pseudomonadota bacterium]